MTAQTRYHVALSYAGEQREYVGKVANILKSHNVRCFYDKDEEVRLWGKDILQALQEIFEKGQASFIVLFLSKEYVSKSFPKVELQYTLAEAIKRQQEYILPARFDKVEVKGLPTTLTYIDLQNKSPEAFADMIIHKLTEGGFYLGSSTQNENVETRHIPKLYDSKFILTVKDESNNPVPDADVYFIHKNGTHLSGESDNQGKYTFDCDRSTVYTIFVAHSRFPALVINDSLFNTDIEVQLKRKLNTCSVIFSDGTGHIPGIKGGLNPILDAIDRTYMYARNISINNNTRQPANFQYGENISLEDAFGNTADIQIHRIIQGCVILDYIIHKNGNSD